ncbi:lipoprotein [Varunaivibrio sulfuroxidans]|uniref:Lipoprotein n=1 Tax=Varunaivibrio sulfuroxidans TaxID=1773489 RepID=A0A4R3JCX6_9PROT|nr:lipoprotein [Varunaivibrio sulfuroxidans]TCS63527.1 hypothetical protein EDD55_103149 [Varunaivibrio sulfuroxidans]WES30328.1 lipoprotein [Varunaivibrio sulfuroxidans]
MTRTDGRYKIQGRRFWAAKGIVIVCALMVMTALAACGRKGSPQPPSGATYPQEYPYNQ